MSNFNIKDYLETVSGPYYWQVYRNRGHWYDANVMNRMKEYPYNVGDRFFPYDNSGCIDLETGEDAYLAGTSWDNEYAGHTFVIVDGPYWDMWYCVDGYTSHRFVTVKDVNTGKLYRVICREFAHQR